MKSKQTIAMLLAVATEQLSPTSTSAALDAELLLAMCVAKNRPYLLAWPEVIPSATQQIQFQHLISKRRQGNPVAYLLGTKAFWTLELNVSPAVLIPRPETEHLVELVLEKIQATSQPNILDLGTGSGAIALALATERPDASITASDQSVEALKVAQANKEKYQLNNVQLLQSDWFQSLPPCHFDIIVSNPPYIETKDPHLISDIHYEPRKALTSGEDGLDAIRTIISHAKEFLQPNGFLIIEHGYNQGSSVRKLFKKASFSHVASIKDYALIDRLSIGKKPSDNIL